MTGAACIAMLSSCAYRRPGTSGALSLDDVAGFQAGVSRYTAIRHNAVAEVPKLKPRATPEEISAYANALADGIRKRRAGARQGAVFTPAAVRGFRRVAQEQVSNASGAEDAIKIGNPPLDPVGSDVVVAVNAAYPASAPVSLMPPALLTRFPRLPQVLEYRFVGRTLVLRDHEANLIVDYAPEVAPPL